MVLHYILVGCPWIEETDEFHATVNVFTAGFKAGSLCLELSFTAEQQVGYGPAFVTCIVPGLAWLNFQSASGRAWSSVNKAQTLWTTVMYRRCKRILKGSVAALLLSGSLILIFFITMEKHSAITLRTQPDDIVAKDATALNVHSTCSTGGWFTICFS